MTWGRICKTGIAGCWLLIGCVADASLEDDYVRCVTNMTRQSANELIAICDGVIQTTTNQELIAFAKIAQSVSKGCLATMDYNLYLEREAFSLCEDVVTNSLISSSAWPRQLAVFIHMSDFSSQGRDSDLVTFATNAMALANGPSTIPAPIWNATLRHADFGDATFRQAFDFWHAVGLLGVNKAANVSVLTNGLPVKLERYIRLLRDI